MFLLRYNHLCKALRAKIPNKRTKPPKFDYQAKLREQMQIKRKDVGEKKQQLIKNMQQVKNMEVVSELDLNLASFKASLIEIRKNMLEENQILPKDSRYTLGTKSIKPTPQVQQVLNKQQQKVDKTIDFFNRSMLLKSLSSLLGINAIGFITSLIGGGYFFGIFLSTILHPSYIAATALMIGKNLSLLLLRHSLLLQKSDKDIQKLDNIDLTSASTFYWFHIVKMLGDIGLLGYLSTELLTMRGESLDILLMAIYILLTGSVTFHSHFLIHDQHHRIKRLIVYMSVLYCLIYGIYAFSYFSQYFGSREQNQKRLAGRKHIEKMFRIEKIKVKNDPINIAIAQKQDSLQ